MKAYLVYSWEGEYEQYQEYEKKYFLNEKSAREYEKKLESEDEESRKGCIQEYGHDKFHHAGVVFDEIEIIED